MVCKELKELNDINVTQNVLSFASVHVCVYVCVRVYARTLKECKKSEMFSINYKNVAMCFDVCITIFYSFTFSIIDSIRNFRCDNLTNDHLFMFACFVV